MPDVADDAVEIRRLKPDDWQLWREVRRRALHEAPEAFGATFSDWDGELDTEPRWRSRLGTVPFNVVAIDGERLVGQVSGTNPDGDGRVELISMFVAPEARGRRIGRALVNAVIDWATPERAPAGVVLAVKRTNAPAIALYERCGFRDAAPRPSAQPDEQCMVRPQ